MKNIDWKNMAFAYEPTDYSYQAKYSDGKWTEGELVTDKNISINECAGVLQYAQTCFEGLKAYRTVQGKVVLFRPDLNARRMKDSCERLCMAIYPENDFVNAVLKTVRANIDWVPPYDTGATMYVRPLMIGSAPVLGVKPSSEYLFRVFGTPVGPYFRGGIRPLRLKISDYDRAAPQGTGHVKGGLNYAMSLYPVEIAHKEGFDENLYLDAATRTHVEETGGANVLFVTGDGTVVTPKSDSILPGITRRSLMYVAKEYLGLKCEERPVALEELKDMKECGLCGTAAVLSPVGSVVNGATEYTFDISDGNMGPTLRKLRETLNGMKLGMIEAPEGWIYTV